jgi:hypothetical protein
MMPNTRTGPGPERTSIQTHRGGSCQMATQPKKALDHGPSGKGMRAGPRSWSPLPSRSGLTRSRVTPRGFVCRHAAPVPEALGGDHRACSPRGVIRSIVPIAPPSSTQLCDTQATESHKPRGAHRVIGEHGQRVLKHAEEAQEADQEHHTGRELAAYGRDQHRARTTTESGPDQRWSRAPFARSVSIRKDVGARPEERVDPEAPQNQNGFHVGIVVWPLIGRCCIYRRRAVAPTTFGLCGRARGERSEAQAA